MGIIFRKRVQVAENTHLNISKSGVSASEKVGPVTINSRGRITIRLLPGLSFRLGGRR